MQPAGQISPDGYWMWNGVQWVPNPYRPVAAAPFAQPYESAGFRATMTTFFLIANAGAVALATSWDFVNIAYLQTAHPDSTFTAVWGVLALGAIAIIYGTLIPTYVFFAMWVHRVVRNMPALGSPDWRTSPGWSVGLSFIPIVNLIYPFLPVLDAWRGSDNSARWLNREARRRLGTPALLVGWWTLWVLALAAARIAYFMERSSDFNTKIGGSIADIVNALFIVGAATLATFVVRHLTARQERKNQMIASGQLV